MVDRERAAEAIAREAKKLRKPISRRAKIVSLTVAAAVTIVVALFVLLSDPEPTAESRKPSADTSSGFIAGLLVGFTAGVVSYAFVHSSRKTP